ncbi:DUF433 domain-containing protein [Microbulbifer okhotskensis]|uniref:DUF433 domain-containing protein n=1 Tax=Microbulbifer okhotskensis TaxID=2926617 RepID=UPI002112EA85|nr:DUF433 domain-containing protein [Microbulbifer okhotskensis]
MCEGAGIIAENILQMLSAGMTISEVIHDFPGLDDEMIRAEIGYAADYLSKGGAD